MNSHPALGLAGDSDFFDWPTGVDARFFLAPEILPFNGYRVSTPSADTGTANGLAAIYSELPRSAS